MKRTRELYLVRDGKAYPGHLDMTPDGINEIFVYAVDPASALALARSYDKFDLDLGNVVVDGVTVSALS